MICSIGPRNGSDQVLYLFSVQQKINILDEMVRELATVGPAEGSWKNFLSQSNKYKCFCNTLKTMPFPLTEDNLCRYIAFLTLSIQTHTAVQSYVNGVKKLHVYARIPWVASSPYVDLVLQGVKRVLDHVVTQAEPMTPEILMSIQKHVNQHDLTQVVCFTALLVSFCLFLRSSNVVSPSANRYSAHKQLSR